MMMNCQFVRKVRISKTSTQCRKPRTRTSTCRFKEWRCNSEDTHGIELYGKERAEGRRKGGLGNDYKGL